MSLISRGIRIQNTLKNTARLSEIISVFARFGFTPWIKKLKLTKLIKPIETHPELLDATLPERLRIAFEHLGPTFIKFGQILATRHDLLPSSYIESFEKLQDQVSPIAFSELKATLNQELGNTLDARIQEIDPNPLGSASIAQVHRARLVTGESIVLKIQKPDVVLKIREDLRILMLLSDLIYHNIPELKTFGIPDLVAEFAECLSKETEFYLEANNIQKFKSLFQDDEHLKLPNVFWEFTTDKVLALEELKGLPLSQPQALKIEGLNTTTLAKRILKNYLEQVFIQGYFHGDLHPGNVLILENNQFGLIDFGMTGRLSHKTKMAVIKMLQALANEDYESLALEYIHLSPFDERIIPERFANGLAQVISPYYGLNLKNVNVGELLLKTAQLAARERLQIPRELLVFFKSLVGIESVIRKLEPEFDFLTASLEFAKNEDTQDHAFTEWRKDIGFLLKDSEHLVKDFPKQIHFLLKKWNSPQFEFKLGGRALEGLRYQIYSVSLAIFWGLISLGLILSISLFVIFDRQNPHNWAMVLLISLGLILFSTHFRLKR
jgi:ubiquinone biosynthesis protein